MSARTSGRARTARSTSAPTIARDMGRDRRRRLAAEIERLELAELAWSTAKLYSPRRHWATRHGAVMVEGRGFVVLAGDERPDSRALWCAARAAGAR